MSAPTSPSLSRFAPNSAELFDFDGSEELWRSWSEGLRPDPALSVSEWADQHRWLEADLTRADQQVPKPRAIIAWMHEGPFSSGWHGDYPTAIKHLVPILQKLPNYCP